MTIDYGLIPAIDQNHWNCQNCGHSLDLSYLLTELVEECKNNIEFKEELYNSSTFDYQDCYCCYHVVCFDETETKELIAFVKNILKD